MKYTLIFTAYLLISSFPTASAKNLKDVYIESASQFQKWCEHLSYRNFRRKKLQPYNWSASTIRQLNDYQTTGSWKVGRKERRVFCQIRVGEKAKYTILEIQ
jgi:hypothetical protein